MFKFHKYGLTFYFYCTKVARTLNGEYYFFECNIEKEGKIVKKGLMYSHSFDINKPNASICDQMVESFKNEGVIDDLI